MSRSEFTVPVTLERRFYQRGIVLIVVEISHRIDIFVNSIRNLQMLCHSCAMITNPAVLGKRRFSEQLQQRRTNSAAKSTDPAEYMPVFLYHRHAHPWGKASRRNLNQRRLQTILY
jgi:hypothetical protein